MLTVPDIDKVVAFATHTEGLFAWITARSTREDARPLSEVATHVGIGFDLRVPIRCTDGSFSNLVYCDGIRGGGVMGWKNHARLVSRLCGNSRRKLWEYTLPVAPLGALGMFKFCEESFGRFKYSERQLWLIYAMHRFGKKIVANPGEIVCSDFAGMVCSVGGFPILDLAGRDTFDSLSPADCQRVWENLDPDWRSVRCPD